MCVTEKKVDCRYRLMTIVTKLSYYSIDDVLLLRSSTRAPDSCYDVHTLNIKFRSDQKVFMVPSSKEKLETLEGTKKKRQVEALNRT